VGRSQLLNLTHHALPQQYTLLVAEGAYPYSEEVDAAARRERELETLLENISDLLKLVKAASRCKNIEDLLDTFEECDSLSRVTQELTDAQIKARETFWNP